MPGVLAMSPCRGCPFLMKVPLAPEENCYNELDVAEWFKGPGKIAWRCHENTDLRCRGNTRFHACRHDVQEKWKDRVASWAAEAVVEIDYETAIEEINKVLR